MPLPTFAPVVGPAPLGRVLVYQFPIPEKVYHVPLRRCEMFAFCGFLERPCDGDILA